MRVRMTTVDTRPAINGTVSSWAEHGEAIGAAWAAPGFRSVHDNMTVAY
jgi:osmotically-inducible protein OsmY